MVKYQIISYPDSYLVIAGDLSPLEFCENDDYNAIIDETEPERNPVATVHIFKELALPITIFLMIVIPIYSFLLYLILSQ